MRQTRIVVVLIFILCLSVKIVSSRRIYNEMRKNMQIEGNKETVPETNVDKDDFDESNIKHVIEQIYLPVIYKSVFSNFYDIEHLLAKKFSRKGNGKINLNNLFYLYSGDDFLSLIGNSKPIFKNNLIGLKSMDDSNDNYNYESNQDLNLDNGMFVPVYENDGKKRFAVIPKPIAVKKADLRDVEYRTNENLDFIENANARNVEGDLRKLILKHEELLAQLKDVSSYL